MKQLAATAQRLRDVKEATRNFLTLWSLEQMRRRVGGGEEMAAQTIQEILDTAALEAAILELDVYASESLVRGLLSDD
ncbi:MAG TPA: hypothetical protein VGR35_04900 [Tepidisphaeraceae bacterium]|nr:hypothetical protein [Tepidisphaeraceae bacterium]